MADAKSSAFRDWVVVVVTVAEMLFKVAAYQNPPQVDRAVPIMTVPCDPDWTEEECEYPDPCACGGR